jgi:hypothetical protein
MPEPRAKEKARAVAEKRQKRKVRDSDNGHDPLAGPEEAAAIARKEAEAKKAEAPATKQPDLPVEALYLEVNLVGQQRNESGDIQAAASMWSDQIFPAEFGKIEDKLREVILAHGASLPQSLIHPAIARDTKNSP